MFRTLHFQPFRGRAFSDAEDAPTAPPVAIISQRLWERKYGSAPAIIGHRLEIDGVPHEIVGIMPVRFDFPSSHTELWLPIRTPVGDWFTVIGVAANVRGTTLEQPADEMVYLPLVITPGLDTLRWTPRGVAVVVRSAGVTDLIATPSEDAVRRLDPAIPLYAPRPMSDVVSHAEVRTRFTLLMLGVASSIALVLGAVGIYGVIAYVVSLRTKEIAVRLALGACASEVRRMVVRQALVVAGIGVVGGVVGAVIMTRALGSLLFGVSPTDAPTLAASALALLVVATAASWVPARRAAAIDPALALRGE